MISRCNFLITSIISLIYRGISGCAKSVVLSPRPNANGNFKLSDSPNFNKLTKRFQHPAGDSNEKSFGDLLIFSKDYFRRDDDDWEKTGFPVVKIAKNGGKN